MQIHLIDAHLTYPGWSEGGLARQLTGRATRHLATLGHTVTATRVEDGYDPDEEVTRHVEADLVVLQTPVNWFGPPWIHKRYVDEVFTAGLHSTRFLETDGRTRSDPTRQYGTGGTLHGRGFFVSATWNAPSSVFDDPDGVLFRGAGVDDFFLQTSASYRFVGFEVLEHHGVYDVFHAAADVPRQIDAITAHLDRQLASLRRLRAAAGPLPCELASPA